MAKKRKLETKSDHELEPSTDPTEEPVEDNPEEAQISEDEQKHQVVENLESTFADPSSTTADAATDNAAPADSDSDESDPSSIHKLLEPFPKDQLISLLTSAAIAHPSILSQIHSIADRDPSLRKIFVHGLGWDTTADTLSSFFCQFGEIEDVNAVTDKLTGKSKGYAFVLFKTRAGARKALKEPQKKIGNRMTACQLASAGPVPPTAPPVSEYTQRKIFVSNVPAEIDLKKLLQFFAKYGAIEEGPLGLDKMTGKPKGFALFVYKTAESAKKALEEPHKNFDGLVLHCQKAIDGPKQNKPVWNQGHHGGGIHFPRNESGGFIGGGSHVGVAPAGGHLMAPSAAAGLGFNQAAAAPNAGLNPALGQALTAILASQGAGLGLSNLLGSLGGGMVNQGVQGPMGNSGVHGMQGGYGNQGNPGVMGGYGAGAPMQGGYGSSMMGQGSVGRGQSGFGHMGGSAPHMGR